MIYPLNAESAKKIVEDSNLEKYALEINEINEKIKAAAGEGNYCITVTNYPAAVYGLYENAGYILNFYEDGRVIFWWNI